MDILCQVWIGLFGMTAVWLVGRLEKWSRWGYICGLLAQPAWFYTTISHGQYGITFLSIFYTYSWSQGAYNHWIKRVEE